MIRTREIPTTSGLARVTSYGRSTATTVVLGHGAGGGIESADLQFLADVLATAGHRVVLVEQPWRVAGRKVASQPPILDAAWLDVLSALRPGRLVVGGRSAGARVACRTAASTRAVGVLALAFPLHPPGRPDRSRADELAGVRLPTIVVQGTRDAFGTPAELRRAVRGVRVLAAPGADHGLGRSGVAAPGLVEAAPGILDFLGELRSGTGS